MSVILVMCKLPVPGRVKTRLTPPLSPEQAAGVAGVFLEHLAGRLPDAVFCHDPHDAGEALRERFGVRRTLPQSGGGLGDRLVAAAEAFPGERVMFLGADAPDVPAEAIDALLTGGPAAIGATSDGGFWGMATDPAIDLRAVFEGVEWSSGRELTQVLANAERQGVEVTDGPAWEDVDDAADLAALLRRSAGTDLHRGLLSVLGDAANGLTRRGGDDAGVDVDVTPEAR